MDRIEKSRNLVHGIFKVRRKLRQKIQQRLKEKGLDISFEMLQVFGGLSQQQGITQQRLAEEVVKDKSALTFLLNNMERKGLVYRRTDPEDRRNRQIYLSPKGDAVMREIRPMLDEFYVSICAILGKEDVVWGTLYMERMLAAIDKADI